MLFSNLISDLEAEDSRLPVLLASRPSAEDGLAQNEAQVKAFGEFLIDDAGQDIDMRPEGSGTGLSVAQVLELCKGLEHAADYNVNGIDTEVLLPDGRTVRSSIPLLGVLGTDTSVLLLLGSAAQWPTVQFQ